jgi:hypothetical protein
MLAGLLALAAQPVPGRAETLVTVRSGDVPPGSAIPVGSPGLPFAFHSGPPDDAEVPIQAGEARPTQALLLAAILVIPAGTTPTTTPAAGSTSVIKSSSVPSNTPTGSTSESPSGGGPHSDLAPEPSSLSMACLGAAWAMLVARRRQTRFRQTPSDLPPEKTTRCQSPGR